MLIAPPRLNVGAWLTLAVAGPTLMLAAALGATSGGLARSAGMWERLGPTLLSPFPGVHIVEATKQAYRAIPVRREKRVLVPRLEPALAPSAGGAARDSVLPASEEN